VTEPACGGAVAEAGSSNESSDSESGASGNSSSGETTSLSAP